MIRLHKPVKLMEWGTGTNTTNQVWSESGKGRIVRNTVVNGLTRLDIEIEGQFEKKNARDTSIKLAQESEGMAAQSKFWGEVAMGDLSAVGSEGGKTVVTIAIAAATKISR
jgi:hypothetical protein